MLHISFFSNLVMTKSVSFNHRMYNIYTKFVKIFEICKQYLNNLVNEYGYIPHCSPIIKFSDFEVIAFSLIAETESINNEEYLFEYKP